MAFSVNIDVMVIFKKLVMNLVWLEFVFYDIQGVKVKNGYYLINTL